MVLTNLQWGLHAWSIYAVCALVIAYFVFRRNAPGLIFIFLVTRADSGTFVVSMMSSKGTLNPSTGVKLIWALIILAITIATLLSGST
jgi:choline-glycine betaine transporter